MSEQYILIPARPSREQKCAGIIWVKVIQKRSVQQGEIEFEPIQGRLKALQGPDEESMTAFTGSSASWL